MRFTLGMAMLALLVSLAACSGGGGHEAALSGDKEARAEALITSGNDAYREGDYRLAVRRYAAAAVVRKDDPAAYYGLGMALSKLGRDEEARQAYARARALSRGEDPDAQSP
jgi:Flp pilus assembly protein TadD